MIDSLTSVIRVCLSWHKKLQYRIQRFFFPFNKFCFVAFVDISNFDISNSIQDPKGRLSYLAVVSSQLADVRTCWFLKFFSPAP